MRQSPLLLSPFLALFAAVMCVFKKERISVLFIDLFYRNQFSGCLFSAFSPLSIREKKNTVKRERERKRQREEKKNTTQRRVNGETELKTYFVGDLKHNAVNYDFFSSLFIRDFLFGYTRSFRYFSSGKFKLIYQFHAKLFRFISLVPSLHKKQLHG